MVKVIYLVAAILFIVGLKQMGRPKTAVRGNTLGALGMLIAVIVTFSDVNTDSLWIIAIGLLVGAVIGAVLAVRIEMTAMPQLVALFNGFGGAASVLVAGSAIRVMSAQSDNEIDVMIATAASGLIGAVTFWGSLIAFGKLQEFKIFWNPWVIPGGQFVNAGLAVLTLALS